MNKRTLATSLSNQLGIPVSKGRKFLDLALAAIANDINKNKTVTITNWGSFHTHQWKGRTVTVPGTGKKIKVANRRRITFKMSKKK